ncbi:hypothetical protein NPIL_650101 [Nephila pilipes]|uniref:Uncharacterized protein n=1 Tax=Nephila pilipes TaxID=299642 RepID=A0A8X6TS80_NEPPI|nr:hypothetical protein NPIL_650101 [Nephila pilipes]
MYPRFLSAGTLIQPGLEVLFLHASTLAQASDVGCSGFTHVLSFFDLGYSPQSEDDPLPGGDLLHKQAFQRQSAFPAAGPERPSQDDASASSNVTRTGRVIKPPQRLDL